MPKAARKVRVEECSNGYLVYVTESGAKDNGDQVLDRFVFADAAALVQWLQKYFAEREAVFLEEVRR